MQLRHTLVIVASLLICAPLARAQSPVDPSGHWDGSLQLPAMDVGFQIDFAKNAKGELAGTIDLDEVLNRAQRDDHLDLNPDEVSEVLKDLEADGDVKVKGGTYQNTKDGFAALTGPVASEGGRQHD